MMPSPSHTLPEANSPASGGLLISTEGRVLPLLGSGVRVQAAGGIARVVLEQRFRNGYDVPLTVTYSFPLPADGAVSGFAFRIGARRVVGEIDRVEAARRRRAHDAGLQPSLGRTGPPRVKGRCSR